MTVFAWLLGFLLPACGTSGTQGLPMPAPFDAARIERGTSPNTALAAPAGFAPPPDIVTPVYRVPPKRLYSAVRATAAAQPRTFLAAEDAATLQAQWVARSRLLNFPDLVAAQILPAAGDASRLVLYSRSVYGYSDLGANRRRLHSWLAAIEAAVAPIAR
ncbi:MAG: DUF1499 domain-containing protein [Acetobacteraceae bacterium]